MRAARTALSTPPSESVQWTALRVRPELAPQGIVVCARTWFAARALAMAELDCGPDDLVVALKVDPLAALFGGATSGVVRDYAAGVRVEASP